MPLASSHLFVWCNSFRRLRTNTFRFCIIISLMGRLEHVSAQLKCFIRVDQRAMRPPSQMQPFSRGHTNTLWLPPDYVLDLCHSPVLRAGLNTPICFASPRRIARTVCPPTQRIIYNVSYCPTLFSDWLFLGLTSLSAQQVTRMVLQAMSVPERMQMLFQLLCQKDRLFLGFADSCTGGVT